MKKILAVLAMIFILVILGSCTINRYYENEDGVYYKASKKEVVEPAPDTNISLQYTEPTINYTYVAYTIPYTYTFYTPYVASYWYYDFGYSWYPYSYYPYYYHHYPYYYHNYYHDYYYTYLYYPHYYHNYPYYKNTYYGHRNSTYKNYTTPSNSIKSNGVVPSPRRTENATYRYSAPNRATARPTDDRKNNVRTTSGTSTRNAVRTAVPQRNYETPERQQTKERIIRPQPQENAPPRQQYERTSQPQPARQAAPQQQSRPQQSTQPRQSAPQQSAPQPARSTGSPTRR